jgi:transcriptional regulatory protein AMDR
LTGAPHSGDSQSVHSTPASAGVAGVDIHAAEDGEYLYKRHLVEFIDQPELIERPIDSKARMTYIGSDLSNINFLVRHQFGAQVKTRDVCHYPTNRISRRMTGHGQADRIPLDAFQLPPKIVVDDLLEAYFRRINPGFPVVDERIFVQQYRARDPSNPPSLLLLQAILVAGAHVLHHDNPEKRDSCKAVFFRRAKALLDAGFERNRDTIVQAALLLTWHTDGLEDVTANAWFWLGVAVRTAMGLGMHRDADGSTLVSHNKRMWRRVWWLLFQSDVWISLQYGRPQSIHLEDCNVQALKISDFSDCGDDVRPDYMLQMSLLAIVVSEAMRARSRASTPEAPLAALKKTDEKLASWALRLPEQLHLHTTSTPDIWTANLHLHYNTTLVLLHRHQPHRISRDSGTRGVSRDEHSEICVAAAGVIQSLFQNICETGNLQCLWISTINCLFTALIQLSTEIRLPNPLLAISALRKYDSALLSLKRLADHWPNAQSVLHFFEKSVRMNVANESALEDSEERSAGTGLELVPPQSIRVDTEGLHDVAILPDVNRIDTPGVIESERVAKLARLDSDDRTSAGCPLQDDTNLESLSINQANFAAVGDTMNESEEMLDMWKQWQMEHWHSPGFSDELLFTF